MKVSGFNIKKFKGIEETDLRFSDHDTARVHTLVGLNESGKTTLLEAIHSFSPDSDTEVVVRGVAGSNEQREQWVPREHFSIFTGDVSVTAYIEATSEDWANYCASAKAQFDFTIDESVLPQNFTIRLCHEYKNGDFVTSALNINIPNLQITAGRGRTFRTPDSKEIMKLSRLLRQQIPTIAYYPTFVFDFPERIYLTARSSTPKNKFYRQLFQDILDSTGAGYTIEDSIIARLHKKDNQGTWDKWYSTWTGTTEEEKVNQVVARAEQAVTEVVFSKWKDVFGEEAGNKRVQIKLHYEKGEVVTKEDGTEAEATVHDAYIQFKIVDGANPYALEHRSLGFRWFFCFLLFTQFRLHREKSRPTIFLFDEPASNLHAAAQIKLLEGFPEIARPPHRLIYSTHSHYMVNPNWLEQAYIVFNSKVDPDGDILSSSLTNQSDIRAVPYRAFVNQHPNKTTYFQPILDTLNVIPSKFDYKQTGVIVEGKNDFYGLRLAATLCGDNSLSIFPATGSGTLGALASLQKGWGLPINVIFDADQGGADGAKKLKKDLALEDESIHRLSDFASEITAIEDLFCDNDKNMLTNGAPMEKSRLNRRVQEILASGEKVKFSTTTKKRMKAVIEGLKQRIAI